MEDADLRYQLLMEFARDSEDLRRAPNFRMPHPGVSIPQRVRVRIWEAAPQHQREAVICYGSRPELGLIDVVGCRSTTMRKLIARSSASSADSTGTSSSGSPSFKMARNAGQVLSERSSQTNDPARQSTSISLLYELPSFRRAGGSASANIDLPLILAKTWSSAG
jgi:hypothetical protein